MGNVDMGKNLKTLPIMVINIWVNILPMIASNSESESVSIFDQQSNQKTESKIFEGIPNPESRIRIL